MTDDDLLFRPTATVLADSVSLLGGKRLTSLEVTLHRFMLPEFNTHRVFSRNSASSRALPMRVTLDRVGSAPLVDPLEWPTEQAGMQGGKQIEDIDEAAWIWMQARVRAWEYAEKLSRLGVHKSVCNRLLEPFMAQTIIVSATDWDNFFQQRCSPLAQPEIRLAAEAMREAISSSEPQPMGRNGWHTPYVTKDEIEAHGIDAACQISAARCARVSYLTHDGKRDVEADLRLFARLVEADPPHASPLEHVAHPRVRAAGNFDGWQQLRHLVLEQ